MQVQWWWPDSSTLFPVSNRPIGSGLPAKAFEGVFAQFDAQSGFFGDADAAVFRPDWRAQ